MELLLPIFLLMTCSALMTNAWITEREKNRRLRTEVARLREGWNTLNELYRKHHECFGCDEEDDLEAQCEFEDELCKLLCNALGHVYGPDQCGKPEHDYCYRCKKLRITDIG